MKLWLITQSKYTGFDTYEGAVVAAETADDARLIHPSGDGDEWNDKTLVFGDYRLRNWPEDAADVSVKYIGEAAPGLCVLGCVVLASYKAG